MTVDDKALVERLKRFSTRPIEHDAPAMNRFAMKEAADRIEAQAAEIERLQVEAKAQFDRGYYEGCANPIVRHDALREALEAAPLINLWESKEDFRRRQDGWLKTKYRAALEQSK